MTDGRIGILDIPSGTGASILGLLGTLYEMRIAKNKSHSTLDVYITAGDISQAALTLYDTMMGLASNWLKTVGIRVEWRCQLWDVTNPDTTSAIVDSWFRQAECEQWIVLIAAISGFLSQEKIHIERNRRFYQHICERLSTRSGFVTWIEPRTNESSWLLKRIEAIGPWGIGLQNIFTKELRIAGFID